MTADAGDDALERIVNILEVRDTEELLAIWQTEARREWSPIGLRAIGDILTRRLGALPDPSETDEQRRARARRVLEQARKAEAAGKLRNALQYAHEAILIAPDLAEAHATLGVFRDTQGDLVGAIRSYRQALRLDPQQADAREHLAGAEQDRQELVQQGYGVAAPQEVLEAEVEGYEDEVPDWVYLDPPALICLGRPGHRTRMGRGGLDPVDTNCEEGYILGLWLRQLATLSFRLPNPAYAVAGLLLGGLAALPLVFTLAELPGNGNTIARLAVTAMYWVPGVLLMGNAVLSLIRQATEELHRRMRTRP